MMVHHTFDMHTRIPLLPWGLEDKNVKVAQEGICGQWFKYAISN